MSEFSKVHKRKFCDAMDDDVENSYNSDDETKVFGKRRIAEIKGGVFECVTLSSFAIENEVPGQQNVSSLSGPDRTVIAINKTISLLSFGEEVDVEDLNLDSFVDCVCCTEDGKFMIAALRNGVLFIYDLINRSTKLSKKVATEVEQGKTICYVRSLSEADRTLVLAVSTSGKVIKLWLSHEDAAYEITEIQANDLTHVSAAEIVYSSLGTLNLVLGGNNIVLYSIEELELLALCPLIDKKMSVKSFCFCPNLACLLSVFENGCITTICPDTLALFNVIETSGLVQQLALISSTEDNPEQLLILSQLGAQFSISMLETDGFTEVYSFSVGEMVKLVEHFGHSNDVMFLEKDDRNSNVKKLLLRTISKSQPEFRLQRLLRQQKYGEAVSFATRYQLDVQEVYKAEATHYINTKIDPEISNKLKEALFNIEDNHFVAECCLKAIMPNLQQTMELLKFGQTRIASAKDDLDLSYQLFQARHKLETYCLVSSSHDYADWKDFYQGDLLMELISFLTGGIIGNACIVWRQHESKLLELLAGDTPSLLDVIPMSTDLERVLSWFRIYIPGVLKKTPETFTEIASIILSKIQKLSKVDTEQWPREALNFCVSAIDILEPEDLSELSGWLIEWQNQNSSPDSPLKELHALHKSLSDLAMINEKINVKLSLDEYTQLGSVEGFHLLLRKTHPKKLKNLINNFNCFALPGSGLECEEIISSYIELEVHSSRRTFDSIRCEEKVFTLFEFLTSSEKITHCVHKILRNSSVPWSKHMEEFAAKAEEKSDSAAHAVRAQRRLAKVKRLLIKYELPFMVNISETHLDTNYVLRAIFHHQLDNMLEDALIIATVRPDLALEVHILYVEFLLNKFKMAQALEHFKSLKPQMQENFCERFLCKAETLILDEPIEGFFEIAGFLTVLENNYRLILGNDMTEYEIERRLSEFSKRVKRVQDVIKAQEKYNIALLSLGNHEQDNFNTIIKEASVEEDCLRAFAKVSQIGQMINLTSTEVKLKIAAQNWSESKLHILRKMLKEEFAPLRITRKEVDLVLQLASKGVNGSVELADILQYVLGYSLSWCPIECVGALMLEAQRAGEIAELLRQKDSIISLQEFSEGEMMSSKDPLKTWTFSPVFDDLPINVTSSAETLTILHSINPTLSLNDPDLVERFFSNIEVMQIQHCDLLALCIISKFLTANMEDVDLAQKLVEIKVSLIHSLLNKVLLEKKADLFLVLELLQNLPFREAADWLGKSIARVKGDCNHLFRIAQLGIDFALLMNKTDTIPQLERFLSLGRWGKRVKKLGISTRGVMSQSVEDKGLVLQQMMIANPNESIDTMFEFCKDFRIDVNVEIMTLIYTLILNWKPELKYEFKHSDTEELVIVSDKNLERKVFSLVRRVTPTYFAGFEKRLDSIWDKLNVYHYEMYECLLKLKTYINPAFTSVQSDVLLFLESYRRTMPPHGLEVDKWMTTHPEGTMLPKLAEVRLPFPSFMQEITNIIKAEVTLKNYTIWLNAPTVLNCDPDEICVAAVTNSVGKELHLTDLHVWDSKTREEFVTDVSDCVNCMQNMSAAAAILDYAAKRIPLGQDRISLMDLCHQKLIVVAEEREDEAADRVEEKVSNKLILYCIVHLLHEHNLARPEYLELATQPAELINALYKDSSIVERIRGAVGNYPDIHAMVGNIGHIASLDVERIRMDILGNLLFSESGSSESLDESFVDISMAWQEYNRESMMSAYEKNLNLLKAQYMLEAGAKQAQVDYITSICNNTSVSITNSVRLRAWRLLLWISPIEEISDITEMNKEAIIEHLTILYFLSELESVQGQTGLTVEQFRGTNIISVIEGLWRNLSSNPRALMLMAKLCLHYDIQSHAVWSNVLSKIIHLKMDHELEMLLPKLNKFISLFGLRPFVTAWNHTIQAPFAKADRPMTEPQYELCKKSFMLMQRCPVISEIETENIFHMCLKKEKFELAAVLLPNIPPNAVANAVQELLLAIKMSELDKRLTKFETESPGFPILQAKITIEKNVSQNGH